MSGCRPVGACSNGYTTAMPLLQLDPPAESSSIQHLSAGHVWPLGAHLAALLDGQLRCRWKYADFCQRPERFFVMTLYEAGMYHVQRQMVRGIRVEEGLSVVVHAMPWLQAGARSSWTGNLHALEPYEL